MTTPLLHTKLVIPPAQGGMLPRAGLIAQLNAGLNRRLTLVSAPPGFGKTTLLSAWVRQAPCPVAWLTLDDDDNDPVRFLRYIAATLQRLDARIGQGVSVLLEAVPPPLMTVLTELINALMDHCPRAILVLDDYHVIAAQQVHDAVAFLLHRAPAGLHIAVATRADPPLPVALLRGRGMLTEIRAADLRFSLTEIADLLEAAGIRLTTEDIVALATRTEGWPAGLRLALLPLRHSNEPGGFVRALTGSQRHVMDYLVEEVLNRQPADIQRFLIYTSILEPMCAELCDALLACVPAAGQDRATLVRDSRSMLALLDRQNLFVAPLDEERHWFRYHQLFADLLRQRLAQEQPELVPLLHRQAAGWYERHGWPAEAVEHALAAGDVEYAAQSIEEAAEAALMRGEIGVVLGWIDRLPASQLRAHPQLAFYSAVLLPLSGRQLDDAAARLNELIAATPGEAFAAAVPLFRMMVASYRGDFREAATQARQALDILPDVSLFIRSFISAVLGLAQLVAGETSAARLALTEAAELGCRVGNRINAVLALVHLAELSLVDGNLAEVESSYTRALEIAGFLRDRQRNPIAGFALIGLSELCYERNDLEAARVYAIDGIALAQRWAEAGAINGYLALALIEQAYGNAGAARQALGRAQEIAVSFDAARIDDLMVQVRLAHLLALQGDQEALQRWLAEEPQALADLLRTPLNRTVYQLASARALLATGQLHEARATLDRLIAESEGAGWHGLLVRALAMRAVALDAMTSAVAALADLQRVIALAAPFRYARTLVDLGAPMRQLLARCRTELMQRRDDPATAPLLDYVDWLLGNFDSALPSAEPQPHLPSTALAEPPTARELEVLRLIAAGKSNREIAEQLVVTESTVKTHINNLYGKLGVVRRTQAIARARELGLIE